MVVGRLAAAGHAERAPLSATEPKPGTRGARGTGGRDPAARAPQGSGTSDVTGATTPSAAGQTGLPSVILADLPDHSLDDVLLVVLLGCNTATEAPDGSTLPEAMLAKGVDTVIAFRGYVHASLGRYWARRFWRLVTGRATPAEEGCGTASTGDAKPFHVGRAADCAAQLTVAYGLAKNFSDYQVETFRRVWVVPESEIVILEPSRNGVAPKAPQGRSGRGDSY